MQRAFSISKLANASKIAHIEQSEIERLYDLLPHGLQTHHDVDVYQVLAKCPVLLTCRKSLVDVTKQPSDECALEAFHREITAKPHFQKSIFPRFTHRSAHGMATFHTSLSALPELWTAAHPALQTVQEYLRPPSLSVSILKAHWQKGKKLVTYYIITNKQGKHGFPRAVPQLPCLVKRLAECNNVEPTTEALLRRKCSVSVKSAAESWALKSLKQIPEVNDAMIEVKKLLESCYLQTRQRVAGLVCDFVCDSQRNWVFLKCKGCCFDTASKQFSQNYEQKKKIDMNFILFPVVDQPKIIRQRIRAASRSDDIGALNSFERRINFLGVAVKKRGRPDDPPKKFDWGRLHKISATPIRRNESDSGLEVASAMQEYEKAMGNMLKYKLGQHLLSNFVEKYGGSGKIGEELTRICKVMRGGSMWKQANMEQRRMMVRGWVRVMEGTNSLSEKQTLRLIHHHKNISHLEYHDFLQRIETALFQLEFSPIDAKAVLGRFQTYEIYICESEGLV